MIIAQHHYLEDKNTFPVVYSSRTNLYTQTEKSLYSELDSKGATQTIIQMQLIKRQCKKDTFNNTIQQKPVNSAAPNVYKTLVMPSVGQRMLSKNPTKSFKMKGDCGYHKWNRSMVMYDTLENQMIMTSVKFSKG